MYYFGIDFDFIEKVWILRSRGLIAFNLFSNSFLISYFHDAVIGWVMGVWNEFRIVFECKFISSQGKEGIHWLLYIDFHLEK